MSIAVPVRLPSEVTSRLRTTSSQAICTAASLHRTARSQYAGSVSAMNAFTSEYASSTQACCAEHTLPSPHAAHIAPALPHAVTTLPARHSPVDEQQPLVHVVAHGGAGQAISTNGITRARRRMTTWTPRPAMTQRERMARDKTTLTQA